MIPVEVYFISERQRQKITSYIRLQEISDAY